MTCLEVLYYGIKHIAKRHNEINGINTELTEHAEGDQKEPEVLIHVNIGLLNQIHRNIALPLAFWRCDDEFFKKNNTKDLMQ